MNKSGYDDFFRSVSAIFLFDKGIKLISFKSLLLPFIDLIIQSFGNIY
ncbi:unnamed protein product [Schistosoma margrebowiei]|uniref:Uncharacterized protein n=1 Tax=Schistosoma margrebowiei TaxID=48269 RepID=A0A183MV76_9TREM|nr:unnamed protein product [Schistosoma margrebowiei]